MYLAYGRLLELAKNGVGRMGYSKCWLKDGQFNRCPYSSPMHEH